MRNPISRSQFKAKLLDFFRRVGTSGEKLVVTDNSRPGLEALRGSLLRYDAPTEPVGVDEWD